MTSGAQFRPKLARNSRIRWDFEAKNPKPSFPFLLFLRLHLPLLSIFFASLFISTLKFYTILNLMYARNFAFTSRFLLEYTPPVNECFYSRLTDEESETRNSQWPSGNHRPACDRRLAASKPFLLHSPPLTLSSLPCPPAALPITFLPLTFPLSF